MENPATWGLPEKAISRILDEQENILPLVLCGLSLERRIADALREQGLLREEPEEVKMLLKVELARKKGRFGKEAAAGFIDPGTMILHAGDQIILGGASWTVMRVRELMPEGEVPLGKRLDRAR